MSGQLRIALLIEFLLIAGCSKPASPLESGSGLPAAATVIAPPSGASSVDVPTVYEDGLLAIERRTLSELRNRGYKFDRNPKADHQWIEKKTGYYLGFESEAGRDLVVLLFGEGDASAYWLLDVVSVVDKLQTKEAIEVSRYLLSQAANKLRNGIRTPTETTKFATIYKVETTPVIGMPFSIIMERPTETVGESKSQ